MNIPNIIKQQLFQAEISYVWSWGAHAWTATAKNSLAFKVNANHFRGIITITLDEGQDLYDIHFFDNSAIPSFVKNKKPSKKFLPMTGVYCDQLVGLIDNTIERIDSYQR